MADDALQDALMVVGIGMAAHSALGATTQLVGAKGFAFDCAVHCLALEILTESVDWFWGGAPHHEHDETNLPLQHAQIVLF